MKEIYKVPSCILSAPTDIDKDHLVQSEIDLILSGNIKSMAAFIESRRINLLSKNGDTPLHFAARAGNLAICDLLIQNGADPESLNYNMQTAAEVAFAEGHVVAAELLHSLIAKPQCVDVSELFDNLCNTNNQLASSEKIDIPESIIANEATTAAVATHDDNLDFVLDFEPEKNPEDFFVQSVGETARGYFVAHAGSATAISEDKEADWELDLSPAPIEGEGITSDHSTTTNSAAEYDFLKVSNRGRQSAKHTVVQSSTNLSITPLECINWAREVLLKGFYTPDDLDVLSTLCNGNGDPTELNCNLKRTLEISGIEIASHDIEQQIGLENIKSEISVDELAQAIEATLTRATKLPGTQLFAMDKAIERQLIAPFVREKQELQLTILNCEAAVDLILDVIDSIRNGTRDPKFTSFKTILPDSNDHTETEEFFAAGETLKSWCAQGCAQDGRQRREAVTALAALELSSAFHKELVNLLEQRLEHQEQASRLHNQILLFERATEHLVSEHLPYVRRFSSRNVEENEDPEDVFQVAFLGLQRSIRTFDPERGTRFVVYCAVWMRQSITRWRADEGAAIRIPAHRYEDLAKLDSTINKLAILTNSIIFDYALANELGWSTEVVRQFRGIPREAVYLERIADWDNLMPEVENTTDSEHHETKIIVAEALSILTERQAAVIRMRFGIGQSSEMTLEEIGQVFGLSRERIRQIESGALARLSLPSRQAQFRELLGI
ncbi:MAG: sigma-70 family RNA polymerase sigma factor [Pseudohongiella sp.]|nr:sigma-70 family RNA polymerase sigma factor [Pseudohongiella sp.]